jgi:O-antigen/teichoic acid export membrane protein
VSSPTLGDAEVEPLYFEAEPAARVVANSAWMLLAQGLATLVGGGVSIYAIRHLTTSSWGHYSTALALVAVLAIFSGPGLAPLALREIAATPERQREILGVTFQALGWSFCVAVVALFAITAALGYPHQVVVLVSVLALSLLLDPALATLGAAFNARFRLAYVALLQVVQSLVYGVLAILVISTSLGVTGLAAATVIASLSATILALALLRTKLRVWPRLGQPPREVWSFLSAAVPIAGISLVTVIYARVDILLLSILSSASTVAYYTVPYSLVRMSWILPSVISAAFFPLLRRTLDSDRTEAGALFFLVVRVFFFLSLPISLLLALGAPALLPFLFGDPYAHSVVVLQIMAWTSVLGFQNYVLWYGLLASHKERAVLVLQLAGLVLNVGINAFAIPLYGQNGAAAALVISDLLVVVGQAALIHRYVFRVPFVELLAKPTAVAAVVVPVALLIASRSAVGGALAGAAAYIVSLILLRYVTLEEWRPVIEVMRAPFFGLLKWLRFNST